MQLLGGRDGRCGPVFVTQAPHEALPPLQVSPLYLAFALIHEMDGQLQPAV